MRFAHPEYLYALLLVPALLVFYILMFRQKREDMKRLGDPTLLTRLSRTVSPGRQQIKIALLLAGVACCLGALARPQLGTKTETVKHEGREIVVAIDVSNSMMAEDIKPSRMERAKHAVRTLVSKLEGDRIGLVAFAGAAFLQCPLTADYGAVELFLSGLDTETAGVQGTVIGQALYTALRTFGENPQGNRAVVLLTDGEDHEDDPLTAARDLARAGVRVYAIGVGTPAGEPIPIRDATGQVTGHRKDKNDTIVMSRLDEVTLQQIAAETGGAYYPSTLDETEIDAIHEAISRMDASAFESKQFTQYEERYQYVLAFGLFFLCLEACIGDRRPPRTEGQGRFE
ncbi:MAG: VWA domain-containing protein [candidate division Zixibacteria bacterium]|nr:VWA domain-containing protein [candidate division Zixibacteria bacterium]